MLRIWQHCDALSASHAAITWEEMTELQLECWSDNWQKEYVLPEVLQGGTLEAERGRSRSRSPPRRSRTVPVRGGSTPFSAPPRRAVQPDRAESAARLVQHAIETVDAAVGEMQLARGSLARALRTFRQ